MTIFLLLTMALGAEAQKNLIGVILKNGDHRTGILVRVNKDSLDLLNSETYRHMILGVSEIKSVKIRGKESMELAMGLGFGLGAVIGGESQIDSNCLSGSCNDGAAAVGGALVGALAGGLLGAAIGSTTGKEFKIEGGQSQFDLFANELSKSPSTRYLIH